MKKVFLGFTLLVLFSGISEASVWTSSAGAITKDKGSLSITVQIFKDGNPDHPFTAQITDEDDATAKITAELKKYSDIDNFVVGKIGPVIYVPPTPPGPPSVQDLARLKFITDLNVYRGMVVSSKICGTVNSMIVCLLDLTSKSATDQFALVLSEYLPEYANFMGGLIVP